MARCAYEPEISKTNLVCLYDRAGLGTSDPAKKLPRTFTDVADDLHQLLKASETPGPYVLVGHSLGGMNILVYAERYPDEVAGVVLVDTAHPDQEDSWLATLPEETSSSDEMLKQTRQFLMKRIGDRGENGEHLDMVASRDHVRAVKSLGDKPLAVLTHSPKWKMVPNLPDALLGPIENATQELQSKLPALSTNSSHKIAEKAGHGLHVEDPKLVIDAIHEVIAKVEEQAKK